jgi:hypothetical protein
MSPVRPAKSTTRARCRSCSPGVLVGWKRSDRPGDIDPRGEPIVDRGDERRESVTLAWPCDNVCSAEGRAADFADARCRSPARPLQRVCTACARPGDGGAVAQCGGLGRGPTQMGQRRSARSVAAGDRRRGGGCTARGSRGALPIRRRGARGAPPVRHPRRSPAARNSWPTRYLGLATRQPEALRRLGFRGHGW